MTSMEDTRERIALRCRGGGFVRLWHKTARHRSYTGELWTDIFRKVAVGVWRVFTPDPFA